MPADFMAALSGLGAKPSVPDATGNSEPSEDSEGAETAAGEIIAAVNNGDAAALAEALRAFVEMC